MKIDDLKVNIKHFFANPNTLTFIFVLVLIGIVYVVYSNMVNKAVSPTTLIYANDNIASETMITSDVLSTTQISGTYVSTIGSKLVQGRGNAIDHRVKKGYNILKNSFIYTDAIEAEANTKVGTDFDDIPDNYSIYKMKTNFHSTYGCSIMPGNYIDVYAETKENGKLVFRKFITSIQVKKVTDSEYNDVFKTLKNTSCNPTYIYFEVPNDIHELLKLAEMAGIDLIIVPRNSNYSLNPKPSEIDEVIKNIVEEKSLIFSN